MKPDTTRVRARRLAAAAIVSIAMLAAGASSALVSSTTTTTVLTGTTTTTQFVPTDVTGGGNFEGGFPKNSFDSYVFELTEPRVLIAETSNGFGGCPGDTLVELRRANTSGTCTVFGDNLPCLAKDDDSGASLCSRLVYPLTEPGNYEIRVSAYDGAMLRRYFLHVEFVRTECGNAELELGEKCDDGNLASGDCCSPSCKFEAQGSPCNDALVCNGADSCNGSGACSQHAGTPCPGPDGDANCAESCSDQLGGCTGPDPNGSPCDDGIFCNGTDTCSGGSCSVHSGNPCAGTDGDGNCSETCSEAAKMCNGKDPDGTSCNDGLFCNGADKCSNGACSVHSGNPCPGPDADGNCVESCSEAADACTQPDPNGSACSDGIFCNGADTCTDGSCIAHAGNPCSGPDGDFQCSESCNELADACTASDPDGSTCNDALACNGADTCLGGACSQHEAAACPGADGDGDCSESCSDSGIGCTGNDPNGSPCDDGVFCNGADTCSNGTCSVHAGSPCPGPDADSNCAESCNEATRTCNAADPASSPCNDGIFCNGGDACDAGLCSLHAGTPCPGPDGDANCAESCDENADACTGADPAQSPCNDGLFCNGADKCLAGACALHAGTPCAGADGDGNCSETCDEGTDTCTAADADGAACNDGMFCNGADACVAGLCTQHAGDPCPGPDGDGNCSESCDETTDKCTAADANGSACDDGIFCDGADTCAGGSCSVHAGDPCPGADGDVDCAESCNEATSTCTANDSNGSVCNDGLGCNGPDACKAGVCDTHSGDPCAGPDRDGDCSESCSDTAPGCDNDDPNGTPCDDGIFCNGADSCSNGTCSVHAGSPCPGADADSNCAESCNEATKTCNAADPNGSVCNDGLFCNGADACANGACSAHNGSPCPGADRDADCAESCNEAADACNAADPNGSVCNDGLFCNGADACSNGSCTTHAGNICAGADNDSNCSESCNEESDNCTAPDPDASSCNDAVFCNGADRCSAGVCSVHLGNPCPGADGDGNCLESCNEASDKCTSPDPNGSACDDGVFCNGTDKCVMGACSQHAGDPCPGADGDIDCSETCDEAAGACTAADADGTSCNNGLACDGTDTCMAGTCSVHSNPVCPGSEGDADCANSCSDAGPGCGSTDPNGTPCDDGIYCNGDDTCSGGTCSVHVGSPCAGPDGDGNCAESCNEATDTCDANDPLGSACSDSDPCTASANCNGAGECLGGSAMDCDDNDECTTDSCLGTSVDCAHAAVPGCSVTTTTENPFVCGDVSGDGLVKASDALNILKSAVGGPQCNGKLCICDTSGNAKLTATDALIALRLAVGSAVTPMCSC